MNEELQSTNEELETINDELRDRTDELNDVNGVHGVDPVQPARRGGGPRPRASRSGVERIRSESVGVAPERRGAGTFLNLDIGLPPGAAGDALHATLRDGDSPESIVLEAVNRRGKPIECTVSFTKLTTPEQKLSGVLVVMEDSDATR